MKQVKQLTMMIALLLGLQSANAALIDQGDITFDDVNGMEWLDLSLTDAMAVDTALATYGSDGWRMATLTEYHAMFDAYVTDYVGTHGGGTYMQVAPGTIQYTEIQNFIGLFGITDSYAPFSWQSSFGLLLDGTTIRLGGVHDMAIAGNLHRDHTGVYSTEGFANAGIFLVREASVPEASTLAMFALGLLGLGFSRRRKA